MLTWALPTPEPGLPFDMWPEDMVLAAMVLGEAEGEPRLGKLAVAWTAVNRAHDPKGRWPRTVLGVCLQPFQFSCFNAKSPRLGPMRFPKRYVTATAWEHSFLSALEAKYLYRDSPVGAANHYAVVGTHPSWARWREPVAVIGAHEFWEL